MNKQIVANRLIRANSKRNRALMPVITAVCFFATVMVGVTSLTV